MNTVYKKILNFLWGIFACESLLAAPVSFNINYTETSGGSSFGAGIFTIDDSTLTSNLFLFNNGDFLDSFTLTFNNTAFPGENMISFGLSDIGAAFLSTDASGNISDINFWTYDRIGLGTNTCSICTDVYLAGVALFNSTLTNPNTNTVLTYTTVLTPNPVPIPAAAWLFGSSLIGLSTIRIKSRISIIVSLTICCYSWLRDGSNVSLLRLISELRRMIRSIIKIC